MEMREYTFTNTEYKKEWMEFVPGTNQKYADGSYSIVNGRKTVYDGAQNLMGWINTDGTIEFNGDKTEYKATFLRAAKEK